MEQKTDGVAAVERALSILNAFRREEEALTLHDIAQRTGMYKSTILRLLASLIRFSAIQQSSDGRYHLGYAVLQWGSVYQSSLRLEQVVVPILEELAATTGEGASYFRRENDVRLCLYRIDSHRSVRDHMHAGDILPLRTGAAGRVLVDYEPGHLPPPHTSVAISIGEREPDIAAVAAPVFQGDGILVGAISVSGPASRFTAPMLRKHMVAVRDAAIATTRRFGGRTAIFDLPLPEVG